MVCFPLLNLSSSSIFNEEITTSLWKLYIVIWIITLNGISYIHRYVIEYDHVKISPTILNIFLSGIIIFLILFYENFTIKQDELNSQFFFQNYVSLILIAILSIEIIETIIYKQLKYFQDFLDKPSGYMFCGLGFYFSIIIFFNFLFILLQDILIKDIFIIIYLIGAISAFYIVIKRPDIFIKLTSRINDFIIFHKSGILLYSYNFEAGQETDESILKGSILIGINHILSSFINKKDQLSLIKMKNQDIILEYDNTYGYAILLITNHRNSLIEKALHQFIEQFNKINNESLTKINNLSQLIDVSEFKNSKEIMDKIFASFLR
jgi:hypothetical protein